MAFKDGARILETTSTTGTGTLTLGGAPSGYTTFLGEIGEGNTCLYWLQDADGIQWEMGLGTVAGATLARTTVIRSSNSDAAITLTAGSHNVINAPVPGRATGNIDFSDAEIQNAHLVAYAEVQNAGAIATGTLTLNMQLANVFAPTLTENVTVAFTNLHGHSTAESVTIIFKQDATGGRTVTWPASVKWAGGTAPTITATASAIDVVTLITNDNGTSLLGFVAGQDFS